MKNRERFHAAMAFERVDRPCHNEQGYWKETYELWKSQGLPEYVKYPAPGYLTDGTDIQKYFNVLRYGHILKFEQFFYPAFKYEVIEETADYIIERTDRGVIQKVNKKGESMPQFLSFPVKCKKDYMDLRDRLITGFNERYPENWQEIADRMNTQDSSLVTLYICGFFAFPRELMGLENFLLTLFDDPDLIKDMINDRLGFYFRLLEKAIKDAPPDMVFLWEDMSYKNGPLISPQMFREFMLPAYKKLTAYLRDMGVRNIIIDSDGDVLKLIPLWLEGGVTGVLPFEVKAGMDVVKIAQEFPTLQIIGGIDKNIIAQGKEAIDEELDRILPFMLKRGGYCVATDHHVPPNINLDAYSYFVEKVREYRG